MKRHIRFHFRVKSTPKCISNHVFFVRTVLLTPPFPLGTLCVHCRRSVKMVCERDDCAFMEVAATDLAFAATRMTLRKEIGAALAKV